jgi:hypothetical protein
VAGPLVFDRGFEGCKVLTLETPFPTFSIACEVVVAMVLAVFLGAGD